jgi:hypothetical protein
MSPRSLRAVTFQAVGPDSSFDAILRSDVLPGLLAWPDVVDAWQGRRGTGDGSHGLVSTWHEGWQADPDGAPDLQLLRSPGLAVLGGVDVVSVEQLEIAVHARFSRPEPARVLRVFHGTTLPGELSDYVAEARAGMTEDAQINDGLVSFVLAHDANDRFISASTWTTWSAIESATGGNTRQPFATRNPRHLATFRIVHLELLPEAPVRAGLLDADRARGGTLEPAT